MTGARGEMQVAHISAFIFLGRFRHAKEYEGASCPAIALQGTVGRMGAPGGTIIKSVAGLSRAKQTEADGRA